MINRRAIFFYLYRSRLLIALLALLLVLFLGYEFATILYGQAQHKYNFISFFIALWSSQSLYLRFIAIMTYIIKPLFAFIATLLLADLINH